MKTLQLLTSNLKNIQTQIAYKSLKIMPSYLRLGCIHLNLNEMTSQKLLSTLLNHYKIHCSAKWVVTIWTSGIRYDRVDEF